MSAHFKLISLAMLAIVPLVSHAQNLVDVPRQLLVFPGAGAEREGLDFELYPLGWSANGEGLAVILALPNEAGDERVWELRVVDLVTDSVELAETIRHPADGNIRTFWNKHNGFVTRELEQREIQRSPFELGRFPALLGARGGDVYEFVLARKYGVEPNFGYEGLESLTLTVIRNGMKSKRIFTDTWTEWQPLAAGVAGFLPGPRGDRIAILVVTVQRGYEGAPHVRQLKIVGSRVGERF